MTETWYTCVTVHIACEGHRATSWCQFFPSTFVWVLRVKLGSPSFLGSPLTSESPHQSFQSPFLFSYRHCHLKDFLRSLLPGLLILLYNCNICACHWYRHSWFFCTGPTATSLSLDLMTLKFWRLILKTFLRSVTDSPLMQKAFMAPECNPTRRACWMVPGLRSYLLCFNSRGGRLIFLCLLRTLGACGREGLSTAGNDVNTAVD